jgi:predicted HicB family RNase H-like nuclease
MYTGLMAEKVVGFFVRLDPDLHTSLSAWAKEEDRSLNKLIVRLLRRAVEERRAA